MKSTQRRLLAFSFANADVLLEADGRRRICYASGATRNLLGARAEDLLGRPLLDLFAEGERGLVLGLLAGLGPEARLPAVAVRLGSVNGAQEMGALLGGYRMEADDPHLYFTLSRARLSAGERALARGRDAETGLLGRDDFAREVGKLLRAAQESGEDSRLALIHMRDDAEFRERLGIEGRQRWFAELGVALRATAGDRRTAGRLAADRYGVLLSSGVDHRLIGTQLRAMARVLDPGAKGADVEESVIEVPRRALAADEAARVLAYAIHRFAEADTRPFTIASLADGVRELASDTVAETIRLKDTVASRGVAVLLQPIVAMGSRRLHHFEALARFAGGESPARAIGLAERVGFIHDVDLLVCQKVVDLMLAAEGPTRPRIAVNFSAASLASASFVGAFRELLAPHANLRPYLLIEITESSTIEDLESAENVLATLRRDGHALCLDDFGAGAASFQYIQALTVDYVKIDGAYVRRVLSNPRDQAILKAMVQLCGELGIGTIAEMVETDAHESKLLSLGVQYGQGYLFGRPMADTLFR